MANKREDDVRLYSDEELDEIIAKKESERAGEISVKISADVSDAITGLKAMQRELRATTKAAREMEQAFEDVDLSGKICCGNNAEDVIVEIDGKKVGKAIVPAYHDLNDVPTKELHEELAKREGVKEFWVGSHGEHAIIKFYDEDGNVSNVDVQGARILVNKD